MLLPDLVKYILMCGVMEASHGSIFLAIFDLDFNFKSSINFANENLLHVVLIKTLRVMGREN